MPTLCGLRRRGYTPRAIRNFSERNGVSKAASTVEYAFLEHCLREDLNETAQRVMAVLRPVKLTITNYPEDQRETVSVEPFQPVDMAPFYNALPFTLTDAQRRCVEEAIADMQSGRPMNRLCQGDVGSGKTMVAAACVYFCVKNGRQAALMAPTELLAEQHYRGLAPLLERLNIRCALLTGSTPAKSKRSVTAQLATGETVDEDELEGRVCYGGLDLSSTTDITAFVLVFPPLDEEDKYIILPYFWIPEDNLTLRVKRDHVPYDVWERQGFLQTTEGNVVHYGFIEQFIERLGERFNIHEIAFDRWGAVQMVQNLEGMGFTVVPFGQGFKDMSPPTKELMKLVLEQKIAHGGHPVLRWNMDNIYIRTDPAGNIKADKEKSTEKIDGAVATIMALDRAIRCGNDGGASVYDDRGLLFI